MRERKAAERVSRLRLLRDERLCLPGEPIAMLVDDAGFDLVFDARDVLADGFADNVGTTAALQPVPEGQPIDAFENRLIKRNHDSLHVEQSIRVDPQ